MEQFAPAGRRYPIALDEWSLKIDNDPNPQPTAVKEASQLGRHIGALTLREALAEATVFNLIHRRPNDFVLTSRTLLYAYLVGLIAIRRDRAFATPAAMMMELYSTDAACQSVKTDVVSSTFSTRAMSPSYPEVKDAKHLDVSARLHPDGKTVDLFVINRNLEHSIDCSVRFPGGSIGSGVETGTLKAETLLARNTFDEPNKVQLERAHLPVDGASLNYKFPAHSITRLTVLRK
jgi:alpha-L-arabinofuranosidase